MKSADILKSIRIAAGLALTGLVLAGCAQKSYVVLLNNDDGSTGKVLVTGSKGKTVLDKAHEGTFIDTETGKTFVAKPEQIQKDFGVAMSARPQKPVSFLLYFETGGSRLTPESELELARIVAEISSRAVPDISIIGHTDTAGDDAANERLGLERAMLVSGLLSSPKLNAENVTVVSHGEKNLLVPTPDNTEEPRNRRVEVTVR